MLPISGLARGTLRFTCVVSLLGPLFLAGNRFGTGFGQWAKLMFHGDEDLVLGHETLCARTISALFILLR